MTFRVLERIYRFERFKNRLNSSAVDELNDWAAAAPCLWATMCLRTSVAKTCIKYDTRTHTYTQTDIHKLHTEEAGTFGKLFVYLAQLNAPLVKRIDAPDKAFDGGAMLKHGQELTRGVGRQVLHQQG